MKTAALILGLVGSIIGIFIGAFGLCGGFCAGAGGSIAGDKSVADGAIGFAAAAFYFIIYSLIAVIPASLIKKFGKVCGIILILIVVLGFATAAFYKGNAWVGWIFQGLALGISGILGFIGAIKEKEVAS